MWISTITQLFTQPAFSLHLAEDFHRNAQERWDEFPDPSAEGLGAAERRPLHIIIIIVMSLIIVAVSRLWRVLAQARVAQKGLIKMYCAGGLRSLECWGASQVLSNGSEKCFVKIKRNIREASTRALQIQQVPLTQWPSHQNFMMNFLFMSESFHFQLQHNVIHRK